MSDTPATLPQGRILTAIGLFLAAVVLFDTMGVFVRMLSARYTAQELSAYRNILGVLPSLALMIHTGELRLRGSNLRIRQWQLAVFRGAVVAVAQLLFYSALGQLEIATVSALGQTNALFVVLFSIVVLGERVGPWRWGAVAIGFAGALWIIRPGGDSFTLAALLPVGAAACYALSMVTVRLIDRSVSAALLYVYASAASAVGALAMTIFSSGFSPLASVADAGLILVMSLCGGVAVLLMTLSYRIASPAVLAPFGYFGLISAFCLGWVFFGEAPLETLFPGVLLIVAGGGLILWRENR